MDGYSTPGDLQQHVRLALTMMWALCDYIHVLDTASLVLQEHERQHALRSGRLFCCSYQALGHFALSRQLCMWMMLPKLHFITHQVDMLEKSAFNPRWQQCYLAETFMGSITRIVGQTHARSALRSSHLRYIMYLAVRWHMTAKGVAHATQ